MDSDFLSGGTTRSEQSSEELRRKEARLRLVAETVVDYAIFTTDVHGCIDSWNPGATRMFGFSEQEAIGLSAAMLFTPEDRERGVPAEEMRQARGRGRASDERWHIRKDGSVFFVSGVTVPLYGTEQTLLGYAKIARDLTERKEWEEAVGQARADLESRVLERTGELASANRALDTELQERRQAEERIRGLMGRLIGVQEDERRRIARDLHDHFGQQLAGLSLKLEMLARLAGDAPQETVVAEAQAIIAKLDRDLDFFTWELRPAALDDLGLVVALGEYVREWSANFGISAEFHTTGLDSSRLAYELETSLYRITQETLTNVYKHAHAGRVGVMLERHASQVRLVVEDDGRGFDVREVGSGGTDRGIGLIGMRERAALVGGTLDIESAPGKGTTIFVKVPIVLAAPE
jgi:PAS domain S-box-containing protein